MAAPTNLPNGFITYFYSILTSPAGSLPKGVTWIIQFEDLQNTILPAINKALIYEPGVKRGASESGASSWATQEAAAIVTGDSYQKTAGCMFCQAIDLPGIDANVIPEGNINYNAFLRSYVGQGRVDFPIMRATFLETNISFADNVLRPWALATATFGLIARPKGTTESYRTNMTCWQLGATNSSKPPTIIKQMTFYDICCVSVNNEELNYLPMSQAVMREAKFIYNYYTIETASNINAFIAEAGAGVQAPTPVLPSELDTRILV